MKLKNLVIRVATVLTMAISLASCADSGPGEHDHVWDGGTVTTEATCHSEGVRTFKCTVEGCDQTKTENIAMTAHNWDAGKVTKEATCSVPGIKTFTCQNEGCGQTKTEAIPTIDHSYVAGEITKIPDLLEKGERQFVCSVCGDIKKESLPEHADYSEQFGLEDSDWGFGYLDSFDPEQATIALTPLELKDGSYKHEGVEFKKGYVSAQGGYAVATYQLPIEAEKIAINYTFSFNGKAENTRIKTHLALVNPTNGAMDYDGVISKDAKDWSFTSEHPLDVTDELKGMVLFAIFENVGEGEANGSLEATFTAKCVHAWDEGKVTKAPTETEAGNKQYTCTKCDEKYNEVIPPLSPEPTSEFIKFVRDETFFPRFDDEHGTLELEANAWLTDDGYTAHSEVTKPLELDKDAYRAGMQLDTGVTLVNGHTYEVTFNSTIKYELGALEQFGVIFQPRKWASISERFDYLTSPEGDQKVTINVTEDLVYDEKPATLWICVEMGTILNEVTLANIKVVDKGLTPGPVDPDDPHPERFNFTDKVIGRFEEGVEGNTWLTDFNHVAHIEVSKAHATTDYYGGAFINTGIGLLAEKTYTVSFKTTRKNETPFTLVLQNKQWDEMILESLNTPLGETEIEIQTSHLSVGDLWIFIKFGTTVNEVTISDLEVTEKGASTPYKTGFFNFTNRVAGRFEGPAGNAWVDEITNTKAHMEVTRARAGHIWEGKMYINTGITLEEGKNYSVSYKINRTEDHDYEVVLQNGKDGQWIATYKKAAEVEGVVNKVTGEISAAQAGTLWVTLQSGDQTNNFEFYDLIVNEVGAAEPGSAIVLKDKIEPCFLGANGSVAVAEDGTNASVNITNAGRESWRGGMFIDTGLNLEAGDYTLSFDSLRDNKWEGYTLILQRNQWEDVEEYAKVFNLKDGSLSIDFTVTSENAGDLWLYVERGSEYNKVTLSNLKVTPKDTTPNPYVNFTGKVGNEDYYSDVVGNIKLVDNGYTAVATRTDEAEGKNAWDAKMHLDTGYDLVANHVYKISLSVDKKVGGYETILVKDNIDGSRYQFLGDQSGDIEAIVPVGADNGGRLWVIVQFGNAKNTVSVSNFKVEDVTDQYANCIDLREKISERTDPGFVGSVYVNGNNPYEFTIQVNTPTDDWKGAGIVNLGTFEPGNYTLSFNAQRIGKTNGFGIDVGTTKFGSDYLQAFGLVDGVSSFDITITSNENPLWILFKAGNTGSKLILSDFKVTPKSDAHSGYINLTDKAEEYLYSTSKGSVILGDDGYSAIIRVDEAVEHRYDAGMKVFLGNYVAGTYTLSFDSQRVGDKGTYDFLIGKPGDGNEIAYGKSYDISSNERIEFVIVLAEASDIILNAQCGDTAGELILSNFSVNNAI